MCKAMCSCVTLLLAYTAYATGESRLAQVEGHGAIIAEAPDTLSESDKAYLLSAEVAATPAPADAVESAIQLLDVIYEGNSLRAFWEAGDYQTADKELLAYKGALPHKAVMYSEIKPRSFMELMKHAGAKPGMKYYDLGSGTGKTVFAAWLLGLDATGVELVQKRHSTACKAVKRAEHVGITQGDPRHGVRFVHGSFLDTARGFSDADIIFSDTSHFSKEMMALLGNTASGLKPGAKIISTTGVPGEGFLLEDTVACNTSQKTGVKWMIQTVGAGPAAADSVLPTGAVLAAELDKKPSSLIRQEPSDAQAPLPVAAVTSDETCSFGQSAGDLTQAGQPSRKFKALTDKVSLLLATLPAK